MGTDAGSPREAGVPSLWRESSALSTVAPGLPEETRPRTPEARPPRRSPSFPRRPPPCPASGWKLQQRLVPRPNTRTFLNVPSRAASLPDDLCSGTSSSPLSGGKTRADGRGSGPPSRRWLACGSGKNWQRLQPGAEALHFDLSLSLFSFDFWKVKLGSGTYSEVRTELVCCASRCCLSK